MAPSELIMKLRRLTQAGMMDIKAALDEAGDNEEKAIEILRKHGEKVAFKKQERDTKEGIIGVYLHTTNKTMAAVELLCETDFVGRTDEFKDLAHDLALHVAAMSPHYLTPEQIPSDVVDKEKEIYVAEAEKLNRPPEVTAKIIEGKLNKLYDEVCLMRQKFLKDETKTIDQLIKEYTAKLGEKIVLSNFIRWQI